MSNFKKVAIATGSVSLLALGLVFAQTSFAASGIKHAQNMGKFTPPAAMGTVAAINGNTITLTGKNSTTYTVDASNATIKKFVAPTTAGAKPTQSTITVSQIQTGDSLVVMGTVSGTNVTATQIVDGKFMGGRAGFGGNQGRGVAGTVSAVSANTLTVSGKNGTTYYVDATNATIKKFTASATAGTKPTVATIQISGIQVGDTVMVSGTVTGTNIVAKQIIDGRFTARKQGTMPKPAAFGTVASISGNTITLTGKNSTTYTVDASNATIKKFTASATAGTKPTVSTITVSQIQTGDNLVVMGTTSGTNITASQITDGNFMGRMGHGFIKPAQPASQQ